MNRLRAVIPNTLSLLRFLITLIIATMLIIPHPLWLVQLLAVCGILTDKLDGSLARLWHTESERGKKLESIIDPLFLFVTVFYLVRFAGLPALIFAIGTAFACIGTLARIVTSKKAEKHFYAKSPVTRIGVGVGYLLIVCYLFQIPYREWLLWPTVVYAGVVLLNYLRMMQRFLTSAAPNSSVLARQIRLLHRAHTAPTACRPMPDRQCPHAATVSSQMQTKTVHQ